VVQAGQVIQSSNGQQIVVHPVASQNGQTIQLAGPNQIQVVPISAGIQVTICRNSD
ncbi:unnamed protein product, partial [Nesidiocoris tenuis]